MTMSAVTQIGVISRNIERKLRSYTELKFVNGRVRFSQNIKNGMNG